MGTVEKKLISAERSRKASLKRQGLNWALKYKQNFHMWYCDVAWKCHPKRESHKKSHRFGKKYILGFRNRFSVSGLVYMERKTG